MRLLLIYITEHSQLLPLLEEVPADMIDDLVSSSQKAELIAFALPSEVVFLAFDELLPDARDMVRSSLSR